MNMPDPNTWNPSPEYLRGLVQQTGFNQVQCARRLGIHPRTMRAYLRLPEPDKEMPYALQYALEVWAELASVA